MPDFSKNPQHFSRILLQWNGEKNIRHVPWKGETDPYKIWLSEIILQQTRVEQGLSYYKNFIKTFPDIHKLAKAPDEKIFKLWEGLGYYTRCRNLIATARFISRELNGKFPVTYDNIKTLKGVGPYTAAAISSFAFNLPHAVVDGNVFRVLTRIFGIFIPVDSTEGKKKITQLANELLDKKKPGLYNQAIMDFGAVVCKPAPLCDQCPFKIYCYAFQSNKINKLPVKEKKINIKKRWFYYFVFDHEGKTAIRQRTGKDIWQQLYEFPMMATGKEESLKSVLSLAEKGGLLQKNKYEIISLSQLYKQQLSHQLISGQFITIKIKRNTGLIDNPIAPNSYRDGWVWMEKNKLKKYTFPKIVNLWLSSRSEFVISHK